MIARSFRSLAWVAAIGVAALACYMLSLRVAAERAELAQLDHRIQVTHQQIRSLQTELGTRGRLQQLEQWNADVLALSAPAANQFVDNEVTLARFDTRQPQIGDQPQVRMAAAPAAPATIRPEAPVRLVSAEARPAPPLAPQPSLVHRASLDVPPALTRPVAARIVKASATAVVPATPAPAHATTRAPAPARTTPHAAAPIRTAQAAPALPPRAAPRRPTALLDNSTLSAIGREARAERRGGARD